MYFSFCFPDLSFSACVESQRLPGVRWKRVRAFYIRLYVFVFHFLLASRIGYVPPTVTGVDLIESFVFDGTFSCRRCWR